EVDHSGDDFDCGFDVNEDNSQVIGEDYENAWHKLMKASKTWVNKNKRLSVYVGNSRTTKWRRKISMEKASAQTQTLETFFKKVNRKKTSFKLFERSEIGIEKEKVETVTVTEEKTSVEEEETVVTEKGEEEEEEKKEDALKIVARDLQKKIQRQNSSVLK